MRCNLDLPFPDVSFSPTRLSNCCGPSTNLIIYSPPPPPSFVFPYPSFYFRTSDENDESRFRCIVASCCTSLLTVTDTPSDTNSVSFSLQANYTDLATVADRRILVPTFADRGVSRGRLDGSPKPLISVLLDRSRYLFIQVVPQLHSRG
jgi:hypothetical protein